jgi:PP-loop superfamily ATP-utilizing enzyme
MKMGLYYSSKPPMQAQVQSIQYAACLSIEATRRIEQLEDTIQSQHGKIRALKCVEEEVGGVCNFFPD